MIEDIMRVLVTNTIHILELFGFLIVAYSSFRSFWKYIVNKLNADDTSIKLDLAQGLALGLEFKLGGEILKTILVSTMEEIKVLAAIIILRLILTFVIHVEISSEIELNEKIKGLFSREQK